MFEGKVNTNSTLGDPVLLLRLSLTFDHAHTAVRPSGTSRGPAADAPKGSPTLLTGPSGRRSLTQEDGTRFSPRPSFGLQYTVPNTPLSLTLPFAPCRSRTLLDQVVAADKQVHHLEHLRPDEADAEVAEAAVLAQVPEQKRCARALDGYIIHQHGQRTGRGGHHR